MSEVVSLLKSSVTSLAPVLFVSFLFSVYKRLTSKTAYGRPTSKKHPQKEKKEKNTHTQTDNRSLTFPGFPNPHSSLESHLNSHGSSNSLLCCVCQVAATGPHLARIWLETGPNLACIWVYLRPLMISKHISSQATYSLRKK